MKKIQRPSHGQVRDEFKNWIIANIGIIIQAITVVLISWQFSLVSGGMVGFALIVDQLTGISIGTFLFVVNTAFLILSFLTTGKAIGIRGIYGYAIFSLTIDILINNLSTVQTEIDSFIIQAFLLSFEAVIIPFCVTFIIRSGYSVGGYTLIYQIIRNFFSISANKFFLLLDTVLIVLTTIFIGSETAILLGINTIIFFLTFKIALKIIPLEKQ